MDFKQKDKGKGKNEKVVSFQKNLDHYLKKGIFYARSHNYLKAIKYFKIIMESEPEDKSAYLTMAYYLSEINRHPQGLDISHDFFTQYFEESNLKHLFLAGIYYCMEEDISGAEHYLKKFIAKNPGSQLKKEAVELLDSIDEVSLFQKNRDYIKLACEYAGKIESTREMMQVKFQSPFVQSKMHEYLYQMDDYMVSNVIFLYGLLENNSIAEKALRYYIKSPIAREEHIELALLSLKKIGAREPYEVMLNNSFVQVTLKSYMNRYTDMDGLYTCWSNVLSRVVKNMSSNNVYSSSSVEKVKHLWSKFINNTYPDIPLLDEHREKAWAAGFELALIELKEVNISSKEVALNYNVPHHKVISKCNCIKSVLRF